MFLDNLAVVHKKFGQGTINAHQGKYITVKFDSCEKIFVYPDAFESFLTLIDGSISDEIISDINSAKIAKQAIIDKKNEENLRAMTKGIVIPGKENLNSEFDDDENHYKSQEQENEEII